MYFKVEAEKTYQRAQTLIEWGCEVFLAIVVASAEQSAPKLAQIPMVSEFSDVFPNEKHPVNEIHECC